MTSTSDKSALHYEKIPPDGSPPATHRPTSRITALDALVQILKTMASLVQLSYSYTGSHEAIISDEMFMAVQQEKLSRFKEPQNHIAMKLSL